VNSCNETKQREGRGRDSSSSSDNDDDDADDSDLDPANLPEGPLPEDLDPTAERRELYIFAIPLRRGKVNSEGGHEGKQCRVELFGGGGMS
jgi:hypothetical protein